MTNTPLTPIEQKEINFYGDELTAVLTNDGRIYASLRHMCQALGIDVQGQRQRINRHTILSRGLMVCKLHTIYKLLPAHRFDEAMQFMTEWQQSLVSDSPF